MNLKLDHYCGEIHRKTDNSKPSRLALVTFFIILFLLRIPDILFNPQFWAEDGKIFFREAICLGPESLLQTYQGYYHLIPRLTAYIASHAEQLYAPAIYCGTALFLTAMVLYLVLSPRLMLPCKPLLALLVVLIPNGAEVYGNITNVHWYLAIGLLVVFLFKPADAGRTLIFELLFVLVAGLTGPFILLMIPVMALLLWSTRTEPSAHRRIVLLTAAACAVASVQAYALLIHGINEPGISAASLKFIDFVTATPVITFIHVLAPYLRAINSVFHFENSISASLFYASVSSVALIASLVLSSLFRKNYVVEKYVFVYFGTVILLAGFYKCRNILHELLYFENGDRYFFIPAIMLSWVLVLMITGRFARYAAVALVSMLLLSSMFYYRRAPLIDYNWPYWISKAKVDSQIIIPINPPGWSINLRCDGTN